MSLSLFEEIHPLRPGKAKSEKPADPPMMVRAVGPEGFVRVNEAFRARTGVSAQELAKKPLLDWVDPDDHARLRAVLAGSGDRCRVRHRTRAGEPLSLEVRVTDQGNGPIVLGLCSMESERPEYPEKNPADEATVSGTLETIARIVEEQNPGYKCSILLVADGRFVRGAGPSLPEEYNAAIDGFAIGPTVGSCGTAIYWNVPVIVSDIQRDPLWAPFAELAKTAGVAACWSHPFTSKSGHVLGALALYAPEPRAPTHAQLGALRASARMTGLAVERGRAEVALREKRKRELELEEQLRQAAKMEALGVLAGGVAHDFNNVLATILANAEFARDLSPEGSEVAGMLANVVEASQRAGEFCQQMLAYAGRGSLRVDRIELGALLPELSSLVQAALSKKTRLCYQPYEGPLFVEGDENQLLQVIMNLVTNAAEAIGDAEGEIRVSSGTSNYDVRALQQLDPKADLPPGEYVRLMVSDTGSGMDDETIARIFDPFFTTKFTGRGLGLSAVKGIIAKHGGVIKIDSKLGEGTTFTILLPRASKPQRAAPVATTMAKEVAGKRILVVDDEDALRAILCRRLKHSGFEVMEAADGEEAINIFRDNAQSIDCVLLDFSMPKRNGEEVHRELTAIRKDIPVVLMSGFNEQEVSDRFGGAKLAGTLQKPIAAKQLVGALRDATTD